MSPTLIKKTTNLLLLISFIFILSGWSFFKTESSLPKDTESLNKVLNGFFVTYWKGAKLSIRALPIKKEMRLFDLATVKKAHEKNLPFGAQLQQTYNWEGLLQGIDEGRKKLNMKELVALGKDIYALPSVLKKTNEDDYPTALEVITNTRSLFKKEPIELPEHWNTSMEHWLFAIAMETQLGFTSWKTYELHGVNPSELQTTDLQTLAFIHKGINHLRNGWYYLAEANFTQALTLLAKDDITLLPHSERFFALFSSTELPTTERFRNHVSGISYLLRSAARKQMGTSEATQLAQQDIAHTVSHFSQAGVDNEFTWLAQSYLHLQHQEPEKALEALTKLESSSLLAKKEKVMLTDVKQQLQLSTEEKASNKSTDNALTMLSDSPIMYKLGMNYAKSYLTEVTWTKLLETTEEGKNMLNHFVNLQETFAKTKQFMNKINPLGGVIH
jgi:hypothetical protein